MSPKEKHLLLLTMGCRVNQFESELLRDACQEQGYVPTPAGEKADLVVVNTCAVTSESDRQARQMIRRAIREHPDARIVVTGCTAQRDPDAMAAIPGVNLVLGNGEKLHLQRFLRETATLPETAVRVGVPFSMADPDQPLFAAGFAERARAIVQVQNGCDERCTFCVIPSLRGPSRSIPLEQALEQCRRFIAAGFKELVLSGVNLGSYGRDLAEPCALVDLAREILALPGLGRLRLGSLDPMDLQEPLIQLFATAPALCPSLHLSVQSGDDRVLKQMKRRHTRQDILERVAQLRTARPELLFGADLIVGFPTETPEAFANSLALVQEAPLSLLHGFRYSSRPGTPAAAIPARFRVASPEISRRAEQLRAVGQQQLLLALQRQVGRSGQLLIESVVDGVAIGKGDSFLECRLPISPEHQIGDLVAIEYVGVDAASWNLLARKKSEKIALTGVET